jgi:hypothetical protein
VEVSGERHTDSNTCTAMERNTLLQFDSVWKCLLDITELSLPA